MKILITVGFVFIVSNLSIFLKKKKFNIFSLDNLFRKGSELNEKRLHENKSKNITNGNGEELVKTGTVSLVK